MADQAQLLRELTGRIEAPLNDDLIIYRRLWLDLKAELKEGGKWSRMFFARMEQAETMAMFKEGRETE